MTFINQNMPRHYAREAAKLKTYEERKQYVETMVPEDRQAAVITYLKIERMWREFYGRKQRKTRKKKSV